MSRRWKWFLRTVLGFCVILALALLIISAILPVLARERVERVLRDLGVPKSAFEVKSATLSGIRLGSVRLGEDAWLNAGDVKVDYSAGSLWESRVKFITIANATYRIRLRDGQFDLGFGPASSGSGAPDLPLTSITLRDCVVVFDLPGEVIRLHVEGVVVRSAVGVLEADLDVTSIESESSNIGNIELADLRATLPLQISMARNEFQIDTLNGQAITVTANSLASGVTRFARPGAQIRSVDEQPLLRFAWGDRGPGLWMNAELQTSRSVDLQSGALESTAEELLASFSYAAPGFEPPQISGRLQLNDASFKSADAGLELRGVSMEAPFTVHLPTPQPGSFQIESVVWKGHAWPGLQGSLAVTGAGVEATAEWTPIENATIRADANLTLQHGELRGDIVANAPIFEWTDDAALAKLFPNAGLDLGGEFSANARLNLANGIITPRIDVRAHNASLAGEDWPTTIDSFSGSVAINGLNPLKSEPNQRIEIHQAQVSETPIRDGSITFALDDLNRIAIREARWNMEELGRFQTSSFVFDPTSPRIATNVTCEGVGLAAWLKLLTDDRIQGEGELSGQMTMTIQPLAREKVSIQEGYLFAQPAGGWIKTDDSEAISRIVEHGTASLSGLGQVRDRVVAALQDYQYTMLRLHFIPEDQGLLCRVLTKGRGRSGPDPQEIESLTINLHGFDAAIRAALAGKSIWDLTD